MSAREVTNLVPDVLLFALPATVRKAEQYFGSFVRLTCSTPSNGELEVRVYLADWRLELGERLLADSERLAQDNNPLLAELKGQELLQVLPRGGGSEITLCFSNGMSLQVAANLDEYDKDDELLLAYLDAALVKFFPLKGFVLAPPVAR